MKSKSRRGPGYFYWLGRIERNSGKEMTGPELKKQRLTLPVHARDSYCYGFHGM